MSKIIEQLMKVIVLLNEKGGVGKTTVSRHIAAGLAMKGHRVIFIDADAQGNATTLFNVPKSSGVYDLIIRDATWKNTLVGVAPSVYADTKDVPGEIYLLPSNVETGLIPMATSQTLLLAERLEELQGWADYVIVDTNPAPSMLHAMIFAAANYVIYPTKCEYLSLSGVADTRHHMQEINEQKRLYRMPEVKLLGIQPTMYDSRTKAHDYGLGLLCNEFGRKVWPALPTRTLWRDIEYAQHTKTVFNYKTEDYRAKAEVLQQVWALVERVEKGVA